MTSQHYDSHWLFLKISSKAHEGLLILGAVLGNLLDKIRMDLLVLDAVGVLQNVILKTKLSFNVQNAQGTFIRVALIRQ